MTLSAAPPVTLRGPRVTLRPWCEGDRDAFAAMNADPEVMRHFTAPLTRAESDASADRNALHIEQHAWGRWALQTPQLEFAGFVGLGSMPVKVAHPAIVPDSREIGWRLARAAWGQGYATEAAALVLDHALKTLRWPQVLSLTAVSNIASQAVMRRIGLQRVHEFDHPRIAVEHSLCRHVLFATPLPA